MNDKTYVRIGRKFVPIPKKEDVVGKWYNIKSNGTPHCFLSEKDLGEVTTGIVVDIKDNCLIVALKGATKRTIKEMYCDCIDDNMYIPEIGDLLSAEKHLRKLYKNYLTHIWSNTKLYYWNPNSSDLYCLILGADSCYVNGYGVDRGYSFFAQVFTKEPINKIIDNNQNIITK